MLCSRKMLQHARPTGVPTSVGHATPQKVQSHPMPRHRTFRTVSHTHREIHQGEHRFEHWYVDNQVYFITARCRDRYPAFASEEAKAIFWDRDEHYARLHGFVPWVTTLADNHYHGLGYLKEGKELGQMMRKIHGSIAKLVNLYDVPYPRYDRNRRGSGE